MTLDEIGKNLLDDVAGVTPVGALRNGLLRIGEIISDHPEVEQTAAATLLNAREQLCAYAENGAGRSVHDLLARIAQELRVAAGPRRPYQPTADNHSVFPAPAPDRNHESMRKKYPHLPPGSY